MTDKEKKELKDGVISIFKSFNILDHTATIGGLRNDILGYINSMQEEPVSIWHDSNEEQPNFASTVAIWSPKYKNGEIISRCTEVYPDRIWAYIDDLLKI